MVEENGTVLDCIICMMIYNRTDRKPLVLTCGHTFCKICITNMFKIKDREGLLCPLDKKVQPWQIVDEVPVNWTIMDLLPNPGPNPDPDPGPNPHPM